MFNLPDTVADTIELAVAEIPGWTPCDQLAALYHLVLSVAHLRGDVLELGSWCGRSAVVLGLAAKSLKSTRVHCVDLFPDAADWYQNADGTYSFKVVINGREYSSYQDQTVWEEPYLRDILPVYQRWGSVKAAFDFFTRRYGVDDLVKPYRMNLDDFASRAPEQLPIKIAFVDGDHSYAAVCRDIETIERYLQPGAWLCFDDAFSFYDGVDSAIEEKIIASGKYHLHQKLTRKLFIARKKN